MVEIFFALPDLSETRYKAIQKLAQRCNINILISYSILLEKPSSVRRIKNFREIVNKIMLDSGAYHVWTGRRSKSWMRLMIHKYAEFAKQNSKLLDYIVAPDIPGNLQATIKNTILFSTMVNDFIPVLQGNSLEEYFKCFRKLRELNLLSKNQIVGFGNITPFKNGRILELESILRALKNEDLKIHLFGANLCLLRKLSAYLYSCDIASWQREIAFRRRTVHRAKSLVDANYKAILTYLQKVSVIRSLGGLSRRDGS
jgi:hypothetical protein